MSRVTLETRANQPQLVIAKVNRHNPFEAVENLLRNAYLSRGIEFPRPRGNLNQSNYRKLTTRVKGDCYNKEPSVTQPFYLHIDMYYHPDSYGGRVHMYFLANADGLLEDVACMERNYFTGFHRKRFENE